MPVAYSPVEAITCALAVLVGITIGLFGGGGSILMVPILTYITRLPTTHAVASSLFIVGLTSAFAILLVVLYDLRRAGQRAAQAQAKASGGSVIRWKLGLAFGVFSMIGAFAGGQLSQLLTRQVIMGVFAVVMLASGIGMMRGRKTKKHPADGAPGTRWGAVAAVATGIGVLSGLVGAGGGFLVVPALSLLLGLNMPAAVGTSLLVVTMQSAAGFMSHALATPLDWGLLAVVSAFAMVGTIAGTALGRRAHAENLKRVFGAFVLLMAAFVLAQEFLLA